MTNYAALWTLGDIGETEESEEIELEPFPETAPVEIPAPSEPVPAGA